MKVVLNIREPEKEKLFLDFIKNLDFLEIVEPAPVNNSKQVQLADFKKLSTFNKKKNIVISPDIDIETIIDEVNA